MKRPFKRFFGKPEPQPSLVRIMGTSQRAPLAVTPPREPEPTGVMPGFRAAAPGTAGGREATTYRAAPARAATQGTAPGVAAAGSPVGPPQRGAAMASAPSPWPSPADAGAGSGAPAPATNPAGQGAPGPAAASPAPRGRRAAAPGTAWVRDGAETPDAARAGRRAAAPRVSLEFSDGRRVAVAGAGVVGRGPRAGAGYRHVLTIEDPGRALSREHFSFGLTPRGLLWVSDLGSANGTLLDDKPLPANVHVPAQPGAVLRFGDHSARVVEH